MSKTGGDLADLCRPKTEEGGEGGEGGGGGGGGETGASINSRMSLSSSAQCSGCVVDDLGAMAANQVVLYLAMFGAFKTRHMEVFLHNNSDDHKD